MPEFGRLLNLSRCFSAGSDMGTCVMPPNNDRGFFGDGTLRILSRAYHIAHREVQLASPRDASRPEVQQRIAKQIIEQAKTGERNPIRLGIRALRSAIPWR